uniref:Ulp1 protease family, C-terminal catalytic domain containing protein n=1 Tax=Solanum tuberosum TaxID=4113 RepID=M1DZH5_SOLTU
MAKEDSSYEMELHDEFVEMVTPVGEPNFRLLSPTPVSHSNCCNIQSVSVLPLPTVDHSVVDRRNEERSKEYLRRRKLEEIKKGKSIAFDHEDQDRSVNVKRRKFIEVASQKSKLKLKLRNISATPFEKSTMNLNDLFEDVVVNDKSNGVEVASLLVDDDFTTTPPVSSKTKNKLEYVPSMNNMNLIDEIRRISNGQKELREDFQVVKQEVHSLKKLMIEFDSKISNAIEALSKKVERNNDSEYEEFRGRGMNVDFDDDYYKNNVNCDQHVTLHLDNIQTINEDSNNEAKIGDNMNGGASSKSIVTWVHPFGSFTMDDDCFKEMGEFREWMNEGHRPRNKNDIQLNNGPYKNKALVDSFNAMMVKDLPSQLAVDRGIYVALFAERFICGSNVVDNECDVNTHRIKFGSLLWKYGKMKLEKHITSES